MRIEQYYIGPTVTNALESYDETHSEFILNLAVPHSTRPVMHMHFMFIKACMCFVNHIMIHMRNLKTRAKLYERQTTDKHSFKFSEHSELTSIERQIIL
jgi:hypothetical protein